MTAFKGENLPFTVLWYDKPGNLTKTCKFQLSSCVLKTSYIPIHAWVLCIYHTISKCLLPMEKKKMCQSRWWLWYQSVSSWFKVKAACNNNRFFLAWWPCWCWQRNEKSQMRRALARTCLCIFYRENRVFWAIYQIQRKNATNYWYQYQDFGVMV